jgi:flagellar biogenesis protein FliO
MKKISIAILISGVLSALIGVAIKNSTGSHSLFFMGLLLEAIALVLFLIILFRK